MFVCSHVIPEGGRADASSIGVGPDGGTQRSLRSYRGALTPALQVILAAADENRLLHESGLLLALLLKATRGLPPSFSCFDCFPIVCCKVLGLVRRVVRNWNVM